MEFKIVYLTKVKQLLAQNSDAASFAKALKAAYPGLVGEEGVEKKAENLYK